MTLEQEILIKENKAREEGREEGIAQGRAEIIRRMHANGRSNEEIARDTGLTEAEVAALLREERSGSGLTGS